MAEENEDLLENLLFLKRFGSRERILPCKEDHIGLQGLQ
jgi:hypothetical protein